MDWHEGSMIQYKQVKTMTNGQIKIEVLGGWEHDQAILERAVMKKAKTECNGDAEIVSSEMGRYYSGSAYHSGYAPKIVSIVKCLKEA